MLGVRGRHVPWWHLVTSLLDTSVTTGLSMGVSWRLHYFRFTFSIRPALPPCASCRVGFISCPLWGVLAQVASP